MGEERREEKRGTRGHFAESGDRVLKVDAPEADIGCQEGKSIP